MQPIEPSRERIIIGVDPGPIAGIVVLRFFPVPVHRPSAAPVVMQVSANAVLPVIRMLASVQGALVYLDYERYVIGARSARTSQATAGATTRNMCGQLDTLATDGLIIKVRSMGQISDYASDERLSAMGLLQITRRMPHAHAAARHAVYGARHDLGIDPFSKRYKSAAQPAASAPNRSALFSAPTTT